MFWKVDFIVFVNVRFSIFQNFMNYSFHCCFGNKDHVYIRMHEMYTLMTEMKSKGLLRICLMLQKPSRKLILLPRHVCFWYDLNFQVAKTWENHYYKNISWALFYKRFLRVRINNWNLVLSKNKLTTIFTWSDK